MNRVFLRDIVIATLISVIAAMMLKDPWMSIILILPILFMVLGVEECEEKLIRYIHAKRILKELTKRKVLSPASKTGLILKYTVIIPRRKRVGNE